MEQILITVSGILDRVWSGAEATAAATAQGANTLSATYGAETLALYGLGAVCLLLLVRVLYLGRRIRHIEYILGHRRRSDVDEAVSQLQSETAALFREVEAIGFQFAAVQRDADRLQRAHPGAGSEFVKRVS